MGLVRRPHCTEADWLTVGPIAPHADAIKQHFANGGYAASCGYAHDAAQRHFTHGGAASARRPA